MNTFDQNQRDQLASTVDLHFMPYGPDVTLSKRGTSILADLVGQSGQESADVAALRAAQIALTQNVPTSDVGWNAFHTQLSGPPTSTAWATTFWRQRFDPSSGSAPPPLADRGDSTPFDPPTEMPVVPPALEPSAFDPPTEMPAVPPALEPSAFDPPTEVRQTAPPALGASAFDPPTEVRQPNTPAPHVPPPAPPANGTRFGWPALLALLLVVGALSFAISWFFLRSDPDPVVSPPDPPPTTVNVTPTPQIVQPTVTSIPITPTTPPTVAPVVDVSCSTSVAQVQVEQQFSIDAEVSPPDPDVVLLFSHGDGGQSNQAPDQIFYFYPGTFDIELEWVSGQNRGTSFCGQVTVSGTPVGYGPCDPSRSPNVNGRYRVNVPDNPDDPENGLVVRLGPGVDKPARDILERTRQDIQLTGCWQPLSGLNPWWQVEGGGWSSSCCLVEQ